MDYLDYQQDRLVFDGQSVADLAERFGTPLYVYSQSRIERNFQALTSALQIAPEQLCYGVKANSNLAVIQLLGRLGAGFDVISVGELEKIQAATGETRKTIFSGVGKMQSEMHRSLELGILCFNLESEPELEALSRLAAKLKLRTPVSLRINPDVDPKTHPYIATGLKSSKFGIDPAEAMRLYHRITQDDYLEATGIDCHIGSQITTAEPLLEAARCLMDIVHRLDEQGIELEHIDLGGGFGVCYRDEEEVDLEALRVGLAELVADRPIKFFFEPGRSIVADAGILISRVLYTKKNGQKHFTIVDAAMNDLLRPALYQAWHQVLPEYKDRYSANVQTDLVGPICETGDFLALERGLDLQSDDLIAFKHAGAYSFVMSSNYNTRLRAGEVMISAGQPHLVRRRERLSDLTGLEQLLPVAD